jgi:hypothetical protein
MVPQQLVTGLGRDKGPMGDPCFFLFAKEPEKSNAEGALHNRAGRTKDASFPPFSIEHMAQRWTFRESSADIHLAG